MNAVFERDYVAFSSAPRFLWMRAGFALAMATLVFFTVAGPYMGSGNDYSGVGSSVLEIAVHLGAGLLVLATPGAFSTVLVHARAQGSLPVLLSTPLTPFSIAFGAFTARISLLMVFVLATWPPIALALLFGGVRGAQLFEASAAVVGTTLLVAAPSFLVSAFAVRTSAAVVTAYLLSASYAVLLVLLGHQLHPAAPWMASAVSPVHALGASLSSTPPPPGPPSFPLPGAYLLLLFGLTTAAVSIAAAAWRLRREGLGDGDPTVAGTAKARAYQPLKYENPILDHELKIGSLAHRKSSGRGLLVLLLASEGAFFAASYGLGGDPRSITLHFSVLGFQCLLLMLGVTAAGATSLSSEHETHVLDLLRVTPITPGQIVVGKLAGLVRGLLPCLLVPAGHLLYASFALGVFSPLAAPALMIVGAVGLAAWALCGMTQSMEQSNPQRAVMRTMGLMGIFGVLTAAMIGVPVHSMFGGIDEFVRDGVGFGANPVAGMLLAAAVLRTGGSTSQTEQMRPVDGDDVAFALVGGGIWLVVYAVVAFALYRRLFTAYRSRFDR